MKLTNSMKATIVHSILADTPEEYSYEQLRMDATALCVSRMPPTVRKLWDKNDTRPWVAMTHSYSLAEHVPSGGIEHPEFVAMRARNRASSVATFKLKKELQMMLAGFTTDVQLRAALPELDKYIPKPTRVVRDLPSCTGVIAALIKAGWSKGDVNYE